MALCFRSKAHSANENMYMYYFRRKMEGGPHSPDPFKHSSAPWCKSVRCTKRSALYRAHFTTLACTTHVLLISQSNKNSCGKQRRSESLLFFSTLGLTQGKPLVPTHQQQQQPRAKRRWNSIGIRGSWGKKWKRSAVPSVWNWKKIEGDRVLFSGGQQDFGSRQHLENAEQGAHTKKTQQPNNHLVFGKNVRLYWTVPYLHLLYQLLSRFSACGFRVYLGLASLSLIYFLFCPLDSFLR